MMMTYSRNLLFMTLIIAVIMNVVKSEESSALTYASVEDQNVYTAFTPNSNVFITGSFKSKIWVKPDENDNSL